MGAYGDTFGELGGEAFSFPEEALFAVLALVGVLESVRNVEPDMRPIAQDARPSANGPAFAVSPLHAVSRPASDAVTRLKYGVADAVSG